MATIKILFLDDMQVRHRGFRNDVERVLSDQTTRFQITHVYDVKSFKEALSKDVYHLICLDHDLSEEHYVDLEETAKLEIGSGTGYDAAVEVANLPHEKQPYVVNIHTWNPSGKQRMESCLKNVERNRYVIFSIAYGNHSWLPSVLQSIDEMIEEDVELSQ